MMMMVMMLLFMLRISFINEYIGHGYRTNLQSLTVNCAQLGASPSGLHTGCPDTEIEGLHKHTIANTTERMTL